MDDTTYYIKLSILFILIVGSNTILPIIYYFYRKKINKSVSQYESLILLIASSCAFAFCMNLSMFGGYKYDYIARYNQSNALSFTIGYIVSILGLKGISLWKKEHWKYTNWLVWLLILGGLYLIDYLLGEYYFWHLYGPLPWHHLQIQ